MGKLQSYGVKGRILTWIKSFLTGRTQVVKVNGSVSESAPVLSGIPQGSVLGPLLFVIYINRLPEAINSDSFLFSDDTKVFREITSKDDVLALQSEIDSLQHWSNKWMLQFHPDKCHVLTLDGPINVTYNYKIICRRKLNRPPWENSEIDPPPPLNPVIYLFQPPPPPHKSGGGGGGGVKPWFSSSRQTISCNIQIQ